MLEKKPLITFALFAYNQEQYIEEAVFGAFSQTYAHLEIILSDDCSSDNTFAIMEKIAKEYKGQHKIILNKNSKNLGLIGHLNKVFTELSNGEIIVVAAGDDISLPKRAMQTWKAFEKDKEIMSVSMNYLRINSEGRIGINSNKLGEDFYTASDYISKKPMPLLGCSRAYKKELIKSFLPLKKTCVAEDHNLVFRSLLIGKVYHLKEEGIKYRWLYNSLSRIYNHSSYEGIVKQNMDDLEFAKCNRYIDTKKYLSMKKIVEYRSRKNLLITNLLLKRARLFYFIKNILFSQYFIASEKMMFFKHVIKEIFIYKK